MLEFKMKKYSKVQFYVCCIVCRELFLYFFTYF